MKKKLILAIIIAVAIAGAASAQVTISGGFALSRAEVTGQGFSITGELGYGGNIYADYLLPIGIPMSLGVEVGYDTSTLLTRQ